jgi:hypothetical protein
MQKTKIPFTLENFAEIEKAYTRQVELRGLAKFNSRNYVKAEKTIEAIEAGLSILLFGNDSKSFNECHAKYHLLRRYKAKVAAVQAYLDKFSEGDPIEFTFDFYSDCEFKILVNGEENFIVVHCADLGTAGFLPKNLNPYASEYSESFVEVEGSKYFVIGENFLPCD